jgi:hypothetical protein
MRIARLCGLMLSALTLAACSSDPPAGTPRAAPRPPAPLAIAKPVDLSLGAGLEMRRPIREGRLALIPIIATSTVPTTRYITLADGLKRHQITVREIPGDIHVDTVRVRNKSSQPLFLMDGELIIDGLQDRVIARDVVVAPHKSARVAVRCVEVGREEGGRNFHASDKVAELSLRAEVVHGTQDAVWAQVARINQRLGLSPPSRTYRLAALAQTAGAAGERRDRMTTSLAANPDRDRMIGVAVVIEGEVVAIDQFATPELFQKLEGELVGSYVASDDAIPPHEGRTFLPDDVRAFAKTSGQATSVASFVALRPPI